MFFASLISTKGLVWIFEEKQYVEVEVQPGDSLWSIATEWEDKSEYGASAMVNWMIEHNYKWDTVIRPGEVIVVPIERKNTQLASK